VPETSQLVQIARSQCETVRDQLQVEISRLRFSLPSIPPARVAMQDSLARHMPLLISTGKRIPLRKTVSDPPFFYGSGMSFPDRRTVDVLLTSLLFLVVCSLLYSARRVILVFVVAILFAYLINPIVRFMERHSLFSRNLRGPAVVEVYQCIYSC
jgi:hypothetical protein